MKLFQIKRDALLKPLQAVSGIVEKRHTLPILSNVLIRRKQSGLSLIATDLEIQVSTGCEDLETSGEEMALTVSARKLQDILRALPEETEAILDIQNNRLQVRAGKSRFNLQTLPANDFPTLAEPGTLLASVRLGQNQFRELLLLVQYSMAQQDIRYYLNGLLLVLEGDQIRLVATDGHRLSYTAGQVTTQQQKTEVILPRKAVLELCKLLEASDEAVEVEIYASQVKFRFGNVELVTKIIDGKFPDYTRVIPRDCARSNGPPPGAATGRYSLERKVPRRALGFDGEQFAHLVHQQRAGGSTRGTGSQLQWRPPRCGIQYYLPSGRAE
jgi:DNA polymerase-3 subunit beta